MNRHDWCPDKRVLVIDQEQSREEQPGKRKRKACLGQQNLASVDGKKEKSATDLLTEDGMAGNLANPGRSGCASSWALQDDPRDSPTTREHAYVASHHHVQEKDFTLIHQIFGFGTSFSSTDTALGGNDTILDKCVSEGETDTPISFINPATVKNGCPMYFIFDCETTGGNHLQDHIMEIGSLVLIPDGVSISTVEFSSLCHTSQNIVHQVSQKCGITTHDLLDQPSFSSVFASFIDWIRACVTEACQNGIPYYPVLVAHNGFAFDFVFMVAEVKCWKLDKIFEGIHICFADTLYDARRLVKDKHQLFAEWSPQEKKRLGLENLYKKCFPGKTYNAHRALEDARALAQIFSFEPLKPLLSLLTIRSRDQIVEHWTEKHHELVTMQPYTIHFGQSCTKPMALCLHNLDLSYDKLKSLFDDNMDNSQAFDDHLQEAGISKKAWREKIWKHFQQIQAF